MGKKAGRWKQAFALVLAVTCVACSVPCMEPARANNLAESAESLELEPGGGGIEETGESEPKENGEENIAEDVEEGGNKEAAGELEPEEHEEYKSIENVTESEGQQHGRVMPEEDGRLAGEVFKEAAEKTDLEPGNTEMETGNPEKSDGNSQGASIEVFSMVSASETAEEEQTVNADYTDRNGVTYSYYGYTDGTAAVYAITGYAGKDVDIPGEIDGYTVTEIQADLPFGANLLSMTVPESITCMGDRIFWGVNIGTLYYNAAEAYDIEHGLPSPFSSARISEFYTGEQVRVIPGEMFASAYFTGSVVLTVAEVDSDAFSFAKFTELTLTDRVKTLHKKAFANSEIQSLHYNTNASHTAGEVTESTFFQATVNALDIEAGIREMPGYVFSGANFTFHEFTVDLERVGDYAFYNVFPLYDPYEAELTVTEKVKYMGACAFARCDITALHMDADMETGASDSMTGAFYGSDVGNLVIGGHVTQIPDYIFSNTKISQDELVLEVSRIGKCAFYADTVVTDLIIGEEVKDIGIKAFGDSKISNISYNAVNATVGGEEEMGADNAPFFSVAFSHISFGNRVESIPRYLFAMAEFSAENLSFPDTVVSVGDMAFYSSMANEITIGNLIVGRDIKHIGMSAFRGCTIGGVVLPFRRCADTRNRKSE